MRVCGCVSACVSEEWCSIEAFFLQGRYDDMASARCLLFFLFSFFFFRGEGWEGRFVGVVCSSFGLFSAEGSHDATKFDRCVFRV